MIPCCIKIIYNNNTEFLSSALENFGCVDTAKVKHTESIYTDMFIPVRTLLLLVKRLIEMISSYSTF